MEIRAIKAEEADEISRIYALSWKSAYRGIVGDAYLDGLNELRWSQILLKEPSSSFVILEKGERVGTASIKYDCDENMKDAGEIVSIYLKPEHTGKGYGKALFAFCLSKLAELGCGSAFLWTFEKNERARAFYESFGFAWDGQKKHLDIGGESIPVIRYVYKFGEGLSANGGKDT